MMSPGEGEEGSTPVRRTSRARKVNPRFVGDDIDESYMKLVGRITAADFSKDKTENKTSCETKDKEVEDEGSHQNKGSDAPSIDKLCEPLNIVLCETVDNKNQGQLQVGKNIIRVISKSKISKKEQYASNNDVHNALTPALLKNKGSLNESDLSSSSHKDAKFKAPASVIVKYRSSTESDASDENDLERKRKLDSLEESLKCKKVKKDSVDSIESGDNIIDSKSLPMLGSKCSNWDLENKVSEGSEMASIENTSSDSSKNLNKMLPSHAAAVKNVDECNQKNINVPSCNISKGSPFKNVLKKAFVAFSSKVEQNQPKIVLTSKSKIDLPGKKLKILSLKPITTIKGKLAPDSPNSVIQGLDALSNQIAVRKVGPLELKIIKKEIIPLSGSKLPLVGNKVNVSNIIEPEMQKKNLESKPSQQEEQKKLSISNVFSSDGEDDIPLNKLLSKSTTKKKNSLLQKSIKKKSDEKKTKKLGIKSKNSLSLVGNVVSKSLTKKKSSDQDDVPLKLLMKKSGKASKESTPKIKKPHSKIKESSLSVDVLQAKKMKGQKSFANVMKLKKLGLKSSKGKNISKAELGEKLSKESNKTKSKGKDATSKMSKLPKDSLEKLLSMKKEIRRLNKVMSRSNKELNIKSKKKSNKPKLKFRFPQTNKMKKFRDEEIAKETTNIVVSVSGIEGDYACLAIDKDHISSTKHDPDLNKVPPKFHKLQTPKNKKYTFISDANSLPNPNKGLVLEEFPVPNSLSCVDGLVLEENVPELQNELDDFQPSKKSKLAKSPDEILTKKKSVTSKDTDTKIALAKDNHLKKHLTKATKLEAIELGSSDDSSIINSASNEVKPKSKKSNAEHILETTSTKALLIEKSENTFEEVIEKPKCSDQLVLEKPKGGEQMVSEKPKGDDQIINEIEQHLVKLDKEKNDIEKHLSKLDKEHQRKLTDGKSKKELKSKTTESKDIKNVAELKKFKEKDSSKFDKENKIKNEKVDNIEVGAEGKYVQKTIDVDKIKRENVKKEQHNLDRSDKKRTRDSKKEEYKSSNLVPDKIAKKERPEETSVKTSKTTKSDDIFKTSDTTSLKSVSNLTKLEENEDSKDILKSKLHNHHKSKSDRKVNREERSKDSSKDRKSSSLFEDSSKDRKSSSLFEDSSKDRKSSSLFEDSSKDRKSSSMFEDSIKDRKSSSLCDVKVEKGEKSKKSSKEKKGSSMEIKQETNLEKPRKSSKERKSISLDIKLESCDNNKVKGKENSFTERDENAKGNLSSPSKEIKKEKKHQDNKQDKESKSDRKSRHELSSDVKGSFESSCSYDERESRHKEDKYKSKHSSHKKHKRDDHHRSHKRKESTHEDQKPKDLERKEFKKEKEDIRKDIQSQSDTSKASKEKPINDSAKQPSFVAEKDDKEGISISKFYNSKPKTIEKCSIKQESVESESLSKSAKPKSKNSSALNADLPKESKVEIKPEVVVDEVYLSNVKVPPVDDLKKELDEKVPDKENQENLDKSSKSKEIRIKKETIDAKITTTKSLKEEVCITEESILSGNEVNKVKKECNNNLNSTKKVNIQESEKRNENSSPHRNLRPRSVKEESDLPLKEKVCHEPLKEKECDIVKEKECDILKEKECDILKEKECDILLKGKECEVPLKEKEFEEPLKEKECIEPLLKKDRALPIIEMEGKVALKEIKCEISLKTKDSITQEKEENSESSLKAIEVQDKHDQTSSREIVKQIEVQEISLLESSMNKSSNLCENGNTLSKTNIDLKLQGDSEEDLVTNATLNSVSSIISVLGKKSLNEKTDTSIFVAQDTVKTSDIPNSLNFPMTPGMEPFNSSKSDGMVLAEIKESPLNIEDISPLIPGMENVKSLEHGRVPIAKKKVVPLKTVKEDNSSNANFSQALFLNSTASILKSIRTKMDPVEVEEPPPKKHKVEEPLSKKNKVEEPSPKKHKVEEPLPQKDEVSKINLVDENLKTEFNIKSSKECDRLSDTSMPMIPLGSIPLPNESTDSLKFTDETNLFNSIGLDSESYSNSSKCEDNSSKTCDLISENTNNLKAKCEEKEKSINVDDNQVLNEIISVNQNEIISNVLIDDQSLVDSVPNSHLEVTIDKPKAEVELTEKEKQEIEKRNADVVLERLKSFEHLEDNLYLVEKIKNKRSKEVRRMVCDCTLSKEEIANNEMGCGDDCINKLLMIECGSRCPLKDNCMNKQFQTRKYANVEVFNAEEKGCGLKACEDIPMGTFITEYIGEVFDTREFKRRRKEYAKGTSAHFYFMALRSDRLIDATRKGNVSRFINHSCSPNAETQKWTVNGDVRIGFFATKFIQAGEEINFDYRLERYGREPQKCYCGTPECRGWLGEAPDEKTKEEKEEDRKKEMRDKKKREERRLYFEDMDLEDEIEKLHLRGLRNRQDTLNLSRLMVRAEDADSRMSLLKLLESGEQACKRLFLDYHGLRLLWSWMVDISSSQKCEPLKLEILKILSSLPITNKTQLTDSRVLSIVERWSKCSNKVDQIQAIDAIAEVESIPLPKDNDEGIADKKSSDTSEDSDAEVSEAKCVEPNLETVSPDDSSLDSNEESVVQNKDNVTEASETDSQIVGITTDNKEKDSSNSSDSNSEYVETDNLSVSELALKLLPLWNNLNEAFRIPKKERIELMKEHEREVDKEYKEYLDKKCNSMGERTQAFYDRWRWSVDKDKGKFRDRREKKRSWWKMDEEEEKDKSLSGLSKEERRERFALKVAKEDEEARQRKLQEEMWTLHLERCSILGHDPYFTPIFDPSGQFYWDPNAASWQPYIGPNGNLPVPATYGVVQTDGLDGLVQSNVNLGQMFMPGAFYPLPHTPVSDGEAPALGKGTSVLNLDLASIPLPGESPLSQSSPMEVSALPIDEEDMDINGSETPPLPPPGPTTIILPTKWKMARDNERHLYFYHTKTRHTQWELPTEDLHQKLMTQYGLNSDSDSDLESDTDSSSSSDSEYFSSDDDENEEEEKEDTLIQISEDVDEKMIRRPKGKKKRSEKLVQERVISPILFEDREAARRERKEAKERAREEARKERWEIYKNVKVVPPKADTETPSDIISEDNVESPKENEDDEHLDMQLLKFSRKQKQMESKGNTKGKSKERAATAMADTSEVARKIKDSFRSRMATYIVSVLNPYRKLECKEGRITSNEDFKYLARKLTHFVMVKELKQLPSIEGLECSDSVKHKTREFVRKYMSKYGNTFKRDPNDTKEY